MILNPNSWPFWLIIIILLIGVIAVISRPLSTYVKFVYPNAKFEAMGNPYIEEKGLSTIIDSKNLQEFKDTLNTSKDYNIEGETTYHIQRSLDEHLLKTMEMMQRDSSKKMNEFYTTYIEKIDISLIKNSLKNRILGKTIDEKNIEQAILSGTKKILEDLKNAEKENMPDVLKTYGFNNEIINLVKQMENIDFIQLDIEIDKQIITRFKQIKVPFKCENGKQKLINHMIDIGNIKNMLRAKQLGYGNDTCKKLFIGEGQEIPPWKFKEMTEVDGVSQIISNLEGTSYYTPLKNVIEDYNKDQSVQTLENALDGFLLKIVRDISTQNYVTIGPTIRFLVSKEFEIKNLKIIAKGVGENLSSETFKNFLILEAAL